MDPIELNGAPYSVLSWCSWHMDTEESICLQSENHTPLFPLCQGVLEPKSSQGTETMQESQMGSNLYYFICWLSHTSTSAISSQNHISFNQMSLNHTNQNPGPIDLYLCHGKLWQSPKVTERMATAVGSCWCLLLLVATCGIEGHAGDSASLARSAGHILFPNPTVSQRTALD